MSPKSQALMQTLGVFASCVASVTGAMLLVTFVPINVIGLGILFAATVYIFFLLYKFNLEQIEIRNRLNQKVDK